MVKELEEKGTYYCEECKLMYKDKKMAEKWCKMCGMPLEDESKEFCSKNCRETYNNIHKNKILIK